LENILYIIALVLTPIAGFIYIQSVRKNEQKPHLGSWILYPTLEIATGIAVIFNGTPKIALIPFMFAFCSIITLSYMITRKQYTTGPLEELWISVALGIAGAFIGIFIKDYIWSQVAFLSGTFIASYLTLKNVLKDPESEDGIAWTMWCVISSLFFIIFLIGDEHTLAQGLTPIGYLFINLVVTIPMFIKRMFNFIECELIG